MNKKKRFLIHEAQKKMIKSAKARVIGNSILSWQSSPFQKIAQPMFQ
jgi:hypothetical protein